MSTVIVKYGENITELQGIDGVNILDFLRENRMAPPSPCGGGGRCGKCTVLLTDSDGSRTVKACSTYLAGDCAIEVSPTEGGITWNSDRTNLTGFSSEREGLGAAVDIGTTTVAVRLFDLKTGESLGIHSEWNAQRASGADVISRIQFSTEKEGGLAFLKNSIRSQIVSMTESLCRDAGRDISEVREYSACGNTVMEHLFAGISPESIGVAPYKPASLFDENKPSELNGAECYIAPCVAGYVGGDITCGLLSSGLYEKGGKNLFVDVGTNGEMAIGGRDGFVSCAVASGPAFEGAGIACGMPALPGAIDKAWIENGKLTFSVIGGGEAKGICGSGLLDIVACLLKLEIINGSGKLLSKDARFNITQDGSVYLSAGDVRQLQLAKAALAAGIKLLLKEEGIEVCNIDGMYLAGGFGNRLNPLSAAAIGMFPPELADKTHTLGNTALSGAAMSLLNPGMKDRLLEIKKRCRYIELSTSSSFSDCFMDELMF